MNNTIRQTVVKIDRKTLDKIRELGKRQVPPIKAPPMIDRLLEFYIKMSKIQDS